MAQLKNTYIKGSGRVYINNIDIFNLIYPVGSIYINTGESNPNTLFGIGVWEKIENSSLVGVGTDFTIGTTGGSYYMAEHSHSATASVTTPTSHNHTGRRTSTANRASGSGDKYGTTSNSTLLVTTSSGAHEHSYTPPATNSTGSGLSSGYTNMPPYLTVEMWKRVE